MGTVLVVDDSAAVRGLLAEICVQAGAETVEPCASGAEAMRAAARAKEVSLVITDVNMPDITGLELVRFFRDQERFRSLPLFVVSTDSSREDLERAMRLGATRYFPKPFDVASLTAAIKEAIGG